MARPRETGSQSYLQGPAPTQYGHQQSPHFPQQLPSNFPPQQQNAYQHYNQQPGYDARMLPQSPATMTPDSAGAPNLQQLLANLRQPGDGQKNMSPNDRPAPDLAGLLSDAVRHQIQGGQFVPHRSRSNSHSIWAGRRMGRGHNNRHRICRTSWKHWQDTIGEATILVGESKIFRDMRRQLHIDATMRDRRSRNDVMARR